MADIIKQVERLQNLFRGNERAHGEYRIKAGHGVPGEKVEGIATTVQTPPSIDIWVEHISGINGVGIVTIRDDATCCFGAIDIDEYNGEVVTVEAMARKVSDMDMPLVCCRSKSGGVHMFLFLKEPVPAKKLRPILASWSEALGYPDVEVFPKQDSVIADRGDFGSWINMPYFDSDCTNRYAVNEKGEKLSLDEFLMYAEGKARTFKEVRAYAIVREKDILDEAPPCLCHICKQGITEGARNNILFNLGVYARYHSPDKWESEIDVYNQRYLDPPISHKELIGLIKSVSGKEYKYTCHQPPMSAFCDQKACRKRKYGIGSALGMPTLKSLTKYDSEPPLWFVDVEGGGRMELTTECIHQQAKFQSRCIEELHMYPALMKPKEWSEIINKLMESLVIIEVPDEVSMPGQIYEHLERWATGKVQAKVIEEVLMGKPYTADGTLQFRLMDFMAYLERMRVHGISSIKVSTILKVHKAEGTKMRIGARTVNLWSMPAFTKAPEPVLPIPEDESLI